MKDTETPAVFLSYASQDAEAAERICEALRAAGVEVWFDRNELVGGDAWDQKIRGQIAACALFVPVVSANTNARGEGYFRLEWKLAVDRSHLMAHDQPFLLPVVIDDTADAAARVPPEFRAVQWTRLRQADGGRLPDEAREKFCARVRTLLGGAAAESTPTRVAALGGFAAFAAPDRPGSGSRMRRWGWIGLAAAGVAAALILALKREAPRTVADPPAVAAKAAAAPQTEAQKLVEQARKIYDDGDELNRENLLLAEELVKRAIDRDPTEASAWELATWLSYTMVWHSIDGSEARRDLLSRQAARLAALAPDSVSARVVHANARLTPGWAGATVQSTREKAMQEIARELLALAQREPGNWQIQRALATAMRFLNRTDESVAAMQRAVELSGGHPNAVGDLINVYVRRGRHEEAEAVLASGLARRPTGRLLTFDLLLKTRWRGDPAAAIATLESDVWPAWLTREDRGAFFAWQAYFWAGQADPALAVVRGVPRDYLRDANFSGPRAALSARVHERAGQAVAAQAYWRLVVQVADRELAINADELSALYWKAWALARLGDLAPARALCALIQQRTQGDQPVFLRGTHLSALLAVAGLTDAALEDLRNYRATFSDGYVITRAVLTLDPAYDSLRADPRFQEIVRAAAAPADAALAASGKSVAVLAFKNVGGDPANEAIVEGVGLELIAVLGRVPGLTVRGSSSLSFFKDAPASTREKGHRLAATYLVDGSIQRSGENLRVTANLTHAASNQIVWSTLPLQRPVKEVFALQEEIATLIAQALSLKLGAGSGAATAAVSAEAFELYVQARQAWNLRTLAGFERAEQLLERALAQEPKFARAHAALADVWLVRGQDGGDVGRFGDRDSPLQRRVLAKIRQALQLDPEAAEAHAALGSALWLGWNPPEAERALRHAIRLNPSYASAHQWLGRALLSQGRVEEAMAELRVATEVDPLSSRIADNRALASFLAGRFTEALTLYDRALALRPDSVQALQQKAIALTELGRKGEAAALLKAIPESHRGAPDQVVEVLARAGLRAEAEAGMAGVDPQRFDRARLLLLLERPAEALASLNPDSVLANKIDHWLYLSAVDPVRSDPRFAAFLATLGLTEAHARAQAWRAAHPPEKAGVNP